MEHPIAPDLFPLSITGLQKQDIPFVTSADKTFRKIVRDFSSTDPAMVEKILRLRKEAEALALNASSGTVVFNPMNPSVFGLYATYKYLHFLSTDFYDDLFGEEAEAHLLGILGSQAQPLLEKLDLLERT